MKESGIHITATELVFTAFSSKKIGLTMYCKSFKILLKDIKYIAISPRLALDDEALFILIIGKNHKIHKIPFAYQAYEFHHFEKYFQLNPIYIEWEKFEYEDHYGKIDKIIYPKEFYWDDLFEKNWKLTVRSLCTIVHPKSCYGNLNNSLKS